MRCLKKLPTVRKSCSNILNAGCSLPFQVKVEWSTPARPNGDIVSYTVYQRDPVQLSMSTTVYTPEDSEFSERRTTLQGLAPYHRSVKAHLHYSKLVMVKNMFLWMHCMYLYIGKKAGTYSI